MGFEIVERATESTRPVWAQVDQADVVRTGMIVTTGVGGVKPFGTSAGFADLTTVAGGAPFGVVIGVNNKTPLFDTTYKTTYITGVTAQADLLARDFVGVEGVHPKGDHCAYAKIVLINSTTVLRGPICNAAFGTAPTEQADDDGTDATGLTTAGSGDDADAASFLAGNSTIYFRTGANAGQYRYGQNTATGAPQTYTAFDYDVALGDVYIQTPIPPLGAAKMEIDAEGSYVEHSATYGTNYYVVNILRVDLSVAGKEHVDFQFLPQAFTHGAIAAS